MHFSIYLFQRESLTFETNFNQLFSGPLVSYKTPEILAIPIAKGCVPTWNG